jgi:hypothetical protein
MALPLKKSLNLSNSSLILRALMYVASLQTFSLLLSLSILQPNMLQLTVLSDIITKVQ